jgi:hypothetical protein
MAEAGENLRGDSRLWHRLTRVGRSRDHARDSVIELDRERRFACGYHRDCFVHPENDGRCIKVSRGDDHRETMRETAYYEHLERREIPWDLIPKFHGFADTSLGRGAVFDLVRDANGEIAKPLGHYLSSPQLAETHRRGLAGALAALRRYLIDHRIAIRTLKAKNLVYRVVSPDEGRLYIVDNIGNTDLIPVATHIRLFAVRKLNRKWSRFERDLLADYADNPHVAGIVAEARRASDLKEPVG